MSDPPHRLVRILASAILPVTIALCLASVVLLIRAWDTPSLPKQFGPKGFSIAFALAAAGTGWVLASRRPSNPIGWIFSVIGVLAGIMGVGAEYALWAVIQESGRPPGGLVAAWIGEWLWIPVVAGLAIAAAIFPDGRFLSRSWRWAILIASAIALIPTVLTATVPELTTYAGYDNPFGIGGDAMQRAGVASTGLLLPLLVLSATTVIARFRRSRGDERLQLKWLALSTSLIAVLLAFYGIVSLTSGTSAIDVDWAEYLMIVAFVSVPISIAFGVLKYRLYDIDIVISKAVVYGGLALFITAVYVAVVVGVGTAVGSIGSAGLSAIAAAIVALAFQPLRRRAQRLANRVVYGKRSTPYEVLSGFSERLGDAYGVDDVLPRMARVLGEAIGAERVAVWLQGSSGFEPTAAWPSAEGLDRSLEIPEEGFEVRHQGELLGAITVDMPPSEPLEGASRKLVTDLAGQAGLVLRNAVLVADLKASRQRLVAARDEERRRLERNIHDGAQQQLVALTVQLRLLEQQIDRDPAAAKTAAASLQLDATAALEDLRDLARGIYPPLLADKGLADALTAQARKSPIPVRVEPDGIGRFAPEIEANVYFCVLEALQNAAKYSEASSIRVELDRSAGSLRFQVVDDGRGFDAASTSRGTGLQGMADRLAAVGGELRLRSRPGAGTTVEGSIPFGDASTRAQQEAR